MGFMQMFGLLEQLGQDSKAVDQSRCIQVRNRNCSCMRCAAACPSGCISRDADTGEMLVETSRCIGCGTCATVCPTGALSMTNPSDSELLRQLAAAAEANGGMAVIACAQTLKQAQGLYDPDRVVGVPCLGRMEEGLILSLAAMGAESVVLVHAACGQCTYKSGSTVAHEVVETAVNLLAVWGSAMSVTMQGKLPGCTRAANAEQAPSRPERERGSYDPARREFLTASRTRIADVALVASGAQEMDAADEKSVVSLIKVRPDGNLPHTVPNRRRRTLAALRKLGQPADEMIGTRLWGHVIIDTDVCQSCRMCATFCPTGALEKFDEDGAFGVCHHPDACSKCRTCETICPAHAITISDEVFAMDLYEGAEERYEMRQNDALPDNPHQMYHAIRSMFHCDQMYER